MKAIHNPLRTLPRRACQTPRKIKRKPKKRPVVAAIRVARRKFLYRAPDDGAKNAAAIERESWNEVEEAEDAVDEGEILGNRQGRRDIHEQTAQKSRRARPGQSS